MVSIHSYFSVAVFAYTANDFPLVHINQPFLKVPSSSRGSNLTSSRGMTCCRLYFMLLITILPYTNKSLNKKNILGFGFFLQAFVRTPSASRTRPEKNNMISRIFSIGKRPGIPSACPEEPKHSSTARIRVVFPSKLTVANS